MFLKTAIEAIKESEKVIMTYFEKKKRIMHKSEIDLVTKADIESERVIVSVIRKRYPSHGFILEEENDFKVDSKYVWIIDPIDGTTNFSKNYPLFSISVALYRKKEPLLGVVYCPYLKELFYATVNKGSFLNNKRIYVSKTNKIREALIATGFPYTRLTSKEDNLNYFNAVVKKALGLRRSGSAALDMCYVACSRLDGYWEIGLKIMDVAAGILIVKEAKGKVSDLQGDEIKNNFSRIVATNGKIHNKLIKILREVE